MTPRLFVGIVIYLLGGLSGFAIAYAIFRQEFKVKPYEILPEEGKKILASVRKFHTHKPTPPSPAPTIKKDLTVGPSVEEAMGKIELWFSRMGSCGNNWMMPEECRKVLAVIKEALLAGAWAIRDRQNEASLSKPAPLPKDVEGAMRWLVDMEKYWSVNDHDGVCIAVIKNALEKAGPLGDTDYWSKMSGYGTWERDMKTHSAPAPSPASLPKEVEEAMADMDELALRSGNFRQRSALAVIQAALRPKVLTRELVDECIARLDGAAQRFPGSCAIDFEYIIRELGYVVEEKP